MDPLPIDDFGYGDEVRKGEVKIFGIWWDAQTNAQEAVDAVWGK